MLSAKNTYEVIDLLRASEIANKRFEKSSIFGYKTEDVEAFLNVVAGDYATLAKENAELEQKMEVLAEKLEQFMEDEGSLRAALLGAQKLGDSVVKESKVKAEAMIKDATEKAESILESSKQKIEKEQLALTKVQREVELFKNRLLALYRQHIELISALPGKVEPLDAPARPSTRTEEPEPPKRNFEEPKPAPQPKPQKLNEEIVPENHEDDDDIFETQQKVNQINARAEKEHFAPKQPPRQEQYADIEDSMEIAISKLHEDDLAEESLQDNNKKVVYDGPKESKYGPLKFGDRFNLERND